MGKQFFVLILGILVLIACLYFVTAAPSGASLTPGANSTAPADPPGTISAYAGNLSEVTIYGVSTTSSWQGYFGNVTGTIELTDASNKSMYNWSQSSPSGEIYASNDSGVIWTNIQCLNFTANGTLCSSDAADQGGETSQCGINVSQLGDYYGVSETDVDGINQTFNKNNHLSFVTNSLSFSAGECSNAKLFNSTGDGSFDEVLLYSPDNKAVVYASLLKNNADGFDSKTHDFEMLVLENGHNGDASITNYYFYVEIQ